MPALSAILLLLCIATPARADLYRWIDPESGSVKLSNLPPVEPGVNAEVVSFRAPAAPKPAVTAEVAASKPAANPIEVLQARLTELMTQLTGASPQDFARAGEGLRQHIEAYDAVRAELDKLDPAGAARRRAESMSFLDKLKQGISTQFGATPPAGQQK
jgi:hypothetical protein